MTIDFNDKNIYFSAMDDGSSDGNNYSEDDGTETITKSQDK